MSKRKNTINTKQIIITIITIVLFSLLSYMAEEQNNRLENNTLANENILYQADDQTNLVNTSEKTESIYNEAVIGENKISGNTENASNTEEVPEYSGNAYIQINNNKPYFNANEYGTNVFEKYSKLDEKGRCGVAFANICKKIMPPEGDKRGDISSVKPTGWKQKKYNGKYLYNRCHLIGYQLSDEDANELNLITGTRYFNVEGMLPFENEVADYIHKNKNNHVLYRITPDFKGDNLLASGIWMEAYSVEDNGKGVCFNVYVYNIQPGVKINYKTGESWSE